MYLYNATLIRVIDGDTVVVVVDLGFEIAHRITLRLYGINAPEMHGESKDAGQAAKSFLISLMDNAHGLEVETYKDKTGKYGRYLATLWTTRTDSMARENVNSAMLKAGHAVPYLCSGQDPEIQE